MSRFKNRYNRLTISKLVGITLLLGCLVLAVSNRHYFYSIIAEKTKHPVDYQDVYVRQVIDGDTIILANYEKVRLIGIDAPERYECDKLFRNASQSGLKPEQIRRMGAMSYTFVRDACEDKYVRLQFDHERYDRYGRILAFVFLEDGTMLNELIVREGYALAMLRYQFNPEYRKRLVNAQKKSRRENKGLWMLNPGLKELLSTL